jgi:hypothetical protein
MIKISKKKLIKKKLSKNRFGGAICKFPNIWENKEECVKKCPDDMFSIYEGNKFQCSQQPSADKESNGIYWNDLSDTKDPGNYFGAYKYLGSNILPHGEGLNIYDNGLILFGNWNEGIPTKGILIHPQFTFEGNLDRNGYTYGKLTEMDGTIYEGTFVDGALHGFGKIIRSDKTIIEGKFESGIFKGQGTITNGHIIHNYPSDEHLFIIPSNEIKSLFKINNEYNTTVSNQSITFLIMLHGLDISNSHCVYNTDKYHVRLVSPVKTDQTNIIYQEDNNDYLIDAYHLARNIFNLKENINATSIQKLEKTIELLNFKSTPKFPIFDNQVFKPLIDHFYSYNNIPPLGGIYIIHDSKNPNIKDDTWPEIDPKLENAQKLEKNPDRNFILRSHLINTYIKKGYNTINIIDLSCRTRKDLDISETYRPIDNDNYKCKYEEKESSFIEEDVVKSLM